MDCAIGRGEVQNRECGQEEVTHPSLYAPGSGRRGGLSSGRNHDDERRE